MKKLILYIVITAILAPVIFAQQLTETRRIVDYAVRDSVDNIGNLYITAWSQLPSVLTFINNDGSITVCTSDESSKTTYIYEYTANLEEQKTMSFKNELDQLGAFTKDNDGNYYFFYACRAVNRDTENMAMVKYNPSGERINTYKLGALAQNSFGGIRVPFDAGTCRLELSGSMLMVYFARERFDRHQASYGFVLDKNTFERVDRGYVYLHSDGTYPRGKNLVAMSGHSFNQFVLPIDGGFVTASHGDAYPRAFAFAKFHNGSDTRRLNSFRFTGAIGANPTYAEMGGLAKTSTGYIFSGTYGKGERNNPRNLFALVFDEDLNRCSAPIYLTSYTRNDGHAGHPKIAALDNGRYLLLWELFRFSTQSANSIAGYRTEYLSTHMLVIDENGNAVSDIQEIKVRLNMNDTLRYNPQNGRVYWAINDGRNAITVYGLMTTSN